MKTLTKIILIVVSVIILLLIVAYLLPSRVTVKRSLVINAPQSNIYNEVNYLREWEKWSPWHKLDPSMKLAYGNKDHGIGAFYTWKSLDKNVGNGKLTIIGTKPYDSLAVAMDFMENGTALGFYLFKPMGESTEVVWGMETELGNNPLARYVGLFMDKMVGKDFEQGLRNLKIVTEAMPKSVYKIDTVTMAELPYVGVVKKSRLTDISQSMASAYAQITKVIAQNKIKQANSPFAIYRNFTSEYVEYEAGIPVDKTVTISGTVKSGVLPVAKAVCLDYYGPYSKLEDGHVAIAKWISDHGVKMTGSPMEVYVTDPVSEKDSSKWLTKIYYKIE